MKRIIILLLASFTWLASNSQTITDTLKLRQAINLYVQPNALNQINAAQLNRILNGVVNVLPSVGGSGGSFGVSTWKGRFGTVIPVSGDYSIGMITGALDSLRKRYDSVTSDARYTKVQRFLDSLSAAQSRIQTKQPLGSYLVAGNNLADVSNITTARSNIGLGNVPNVDATNASNISSGTLADARLSGNVTVQGNSFNGANQLVKTGSDGKLLPGVIPALALVDTYTPASQAAMLALPAEQGDIAIRTDINVAYILYQAPATTLGNWIALPAPSSETDPLYTASSWYGTTNNSSNWNTAYSWGNWAAGSHYIGTTLIANNRASASQILTGVSIDGTAAGETLATVTGRGASTGVVISAGAFRASATNTIGWTGQGGFESVSNGVYKLYNEARSAYGDITIGALTAGAIIGTTGTFSVSSAVNMVRMTRSGVTNGDWGFFHGDNGGNGHLYLVNNSTGITGLTIKDDGGIGVGTTTPYSLTNYKFLTTSGVSGGGLVLQKAGVTKGTYYSANDNVYLDAVGSIIIATGGVIGGGTTALTITSSQVSTFSGGGSGLAVVNMVNSSSSGYGLDLTGGTNSNFVLRLRNYDNSITALTVLGNGNTTAAGSVTAPAFYESSDIRQKKVHTTVSSIDGIDAIQYTFKPNGTEKWGYSAQQVQKVISMAVTKADDGFLKVDYTTVHTYKIMQLEQRISQLEKQLKR